MSKYTGIKEQFEANRDEVKAKDMSAYMLNKFPYYGLLTPKRRVFYKELLKSEKKSKTIDWDFLDECWNAEYREFQYVAMEYLIAMQEFLTYDDVDHLRQYVKTKQWWDTIDGLDRIIGDIGLVDERINNLMLKWSKDEDFWVRRIAIDHQLCRKGKTNTGLLKKILVNNFGSDEFFINKAIGWSLRDYSKTNPEWVRNFIEKYRDRMDKLSVREGGKYV